MARGFFVTGTDTGVGKTVVSAALMCIYRKRSPVRYWKPIQTGIEQDDDTADVTRLAGCTAAETLNRGVRLERPVSPHLAAQLSGVTISIESLLTEWGSDVRRPDTFWIIEGAGGVLVPINDRELMADLIARLGLPALVVARTRLGTINHTLMTLEALRARRIGIAGVVMAGPPDADAGAAIERHGRTAVTAFPTLDPLTPGAVAGWADQASPSWLI